MKRDSNLTVLLLIVAATAAIYLRSAWFPFSAIDDHIYVTQNPRVTTGLSLESVRWAFTTFHAANWHPVTWLSLMLDGQLFGVNAGGYHVVNTLLHALNAGLLYLLLVSMTGAVGRSAFAAALFALHPLHVESVAWISERKDVLSTLFMMLTLLGYLSYVRSRSARSYLLSLAAFALGLMAKPMLVTLPILLFLLDYWPLKRLELPFRKGGVKALLREKVPFLLLSGASSLMTVLAQKSGEAVATLTQMPFFYRACNALWATLSYLEKSLFPFDLAVYYPFALVPVWKAALAGVFLLALTAAVVLSCRRYGYLLLGWFWFLITLVPVIGLVQVGAQAMADRYTYVPYIGLGIIAAWGGAEVGEKLRVARQAVPVAAAVALLFFSVLTWTRLGLWQDNVRLLQHTLSVTQNNYFAHFALGGWYEEQGKMDLALQEYREVLRIHPGAKGIHLYLGNALAREGRAEEAIPYLQEALRRNPNLGSAHFYLGTSFEKLGRDAEALASYAEAVRLIPENPRYHTNYGSALARQGKLNEAIEAFSRALEINPKDRKAAEYLQLALSLKNRGGVP